MALEWRWVAGSSKKSAFEVLLRASPRLAWRFHAQVLPAIVAQVQPTKNLDPASSEAIAIGYAAQRGEEPVPVAGEVDVRLALLALLEGLVRAGAADWECGRPISEACETVLRCIVVPNLVWKVGRVEATVRKVALAVCFGMLKAGAAKAEALYKAASELVPLVVSHLDDTDESPRLMSCLCLRILFDRLRGAFGEQAVHEMYPKLLKRLDDSSDEIRCAACSALEAFLRCAPAHCYSGTTLDYTLDQLFVHLDDQDPRIQEAVFAVLVAAAPLGRELVLKKADTNRSTHRTPHACNRLTAEVQGFEILND